MLAGKPFHRVVAALMNVRSSNVVVLVRDTVNETVDSDHSERVSLYMDSRPPKYSGVCWWIARKECDRILYCIRRWTGSQCSSFRAGVMCERRLVLVIMCEHAFCRRCICASRFTGRPCSKELQ